MAILGIEERRNGYGRLVVFTEPHPEAPAMDSTIFDNGDVLEDLRSVQSFLDDIGEGFVLEASLSDYLKENDLSMPDLMERAEGGERGVPLPRYVPA